MPTKTPAVIATILTVILLIVLAIVSVLFEMLALNGASESQGGLAMSISVICQGVGTILLGIFAWRLTSLLTTKFNWNSIIAVLASVFLATVLGMGISFLSIIISIPAAGIR